MATHVSKNETTGSGQASITQGGVAVQSGDCIIVFASHEDSGSVTGVDDNASGGSNVYTERHADASTTTATFQRVFTAIAKASETLSVTAHFGSTPVFEECCVFVGRPASGKQFVYDAAGGQGCGGTPNGNATTGSVTVAGTGGYAAAIAKPYSPGNWGDVSGWTDDNGSNGPTRAYRILTNETSIVYNPVYDTATDWVANLAAFKEVSGSSFNAAWARNSNIVLQ